MDIVIDRANLKIVMQIPKKKEITKKRKKKKRRSLPRKGSVLYFSLFITLIHIKIQIIFKMEPPEDSFDPLNTHTDVSFKEKFEDFYIRDMVEFNLRKSAYQATPYCLKECDIFGEESEFNKVCLENCLGKHTDSFELGMKIFGDASKYGGGSSLASADKDMIGGQKFVQPIYE